uniref:Superoxide dismutase copper/zinc binding domain-containing protein n=1 Tax=Romanomermis culicivorax TaxID=13658 RepID=A0A915ILR2_ROMCU
MNETKNKIDHLEATAIMKGSHGINGVVYFQQSGSDAQSPVYIFGKISKLPKGRHGLHVHQLAGDLVTNGKCTNLGQHFDTPNPGFDPNGQMLEHRHGNPDDKSSHSGDLGNLEGAEKAENGFEMETEKVSLYGANSIIGRSLVVHKYKDDFGSKNTTESLTDGNSGPPIACGVIVWKDVVITS